MTKSKIEIKSNSTKSSKIIKENDSKGSAKNSAKQSNSNSSKNSKKDSKDISKESVMINPLLLKIKDFDVIKKEYDLTEENLSPMLVIHKMSETLEFYLKIIQQILQPEEFHALYECNAFDDKDKAKLFDLYKNLVILHREMLKALIINEDTNSISTIGLVHKEVQGVKPEMVEIISKMQTSWREYSQKDKNKGTQYFG